MTAKELIDVLLQFQDDAVVLVNDGDSVSPIEGSSLDYRFNECILEANPNNYLGSRAGIYNRSLVKYKIAQLSKLEENWDGYGASVVDDKCIKNASWVIGELKFLHDVDVYPSTSGTINMDWDEDNERISAEFGRETFSYYYKFKKGVKFCNDLKYEYSAAYQLECDLKRMFKEH
jgi:hypothetical protein